jgi:hypothetical protein
MFVLKLPTERENTKLSFAREPVQAKISVKQNNTFIIYSPNFAPSLCVILPFGGFLSG